MTHMDRLGELLDGVGTLVGRIWSRALASTPALEAPVVLVLGVVALGAVTIRPAWRVARHLVTIAHEGAHGLTAVLTGRRLAGIRLHSDTSGLTVSRGSPHGPGMILTAFAGYVGPSLIGLGAAWLLREGYAMGVLWALVLALAVLLVQIRNWFGLWSVLATGAALVAVSWWAPVEAGSAAAYALVWLLLLGGVRAVLEVPAQRKRGRALTSDADQLARLTRIPAPAWIAAFFAVTAGALLLGGSWIVDLG